MITIKKIAEFYEKNHFNPEDMDNNFNDHCLIMQQFANQVLDKYKENEKKKRCQCENPHSVLNRFGCLNCNKPL